MPHRLSRRVFRRALKNYSPSRYEAFGETGARFVRPRRHALKSRDRFYVALRSGLRCLPAVHCTVIDFSPSPGSLPRLLRTLHPSKDLLVMQTGFEVAQRRFFLGEDTRDCVQPLRQLWINLTKLPFYAVPHLRGSLLVVGRKPT